MQIIQTTNDVACSRDILDMTVDWKFHYRILINHTHSLKIFIRLLWKRFSQLSQTITTLNFVMGLINHVVLTLWLSMLLASSHLSDGYASYKNTAKNIDDKVWKENVILLYFCQNAVAYRANVPIYIFLCILCISLFIFIFIFNDIDKLANRLDKFKFNCTVLESIKPSFSSHKCFSHHQTGMLW